MKFVERALGHAGDEALPDPGGSTRSEMIGARIPVVKAADHRNLASIRRPHTEDRSLFSVARDQVSAHRLVEAIVAALVEQVKILIGEQRHSVRSGGNGGFWHLPIS